MIKKFKLKKGDEVIVITGKDKGKTGKILKMLPKQMKAIVSEINRVKKNQKPDNNQPGGIIDKEMPIHVSNLLFYDREQNKGIKVGFKTKRLGKERFGVKTLPTRIDFITRDHSRSKLGLKDPLRNVVVRKDPRR